MYRPYSLCSAEDVRVVGEFRSLVEKVVQHRHWLFPMDIAIGRDTSAPMRILIVKSDYQVQHSMKVLGVLALGKACGEGSLQLFDLVFDQSLVSRLFREAISVKYRLCSHVGIV